MSVHRLVELIGCLRLPLHDEKQLQSELAEWLERRGFQFDREYRLGAGDIVDFLLEDGLAVECKLKGGKRNIYRQLRRYAQHSRVRAILLVTNTAMGLPEEIEGKPAYYCSLGAAWL